MHRKMKRVSRYSSNVNGNVDTASIKAGRATNGMGANPISTNVALTHLIGRQLTNDGSGHGNGAGIVAADGDRDGDGDGDRDEDGNGNGNGYRDRAVNMQPGGMVKINSYVPNGNENNKNKNKIKNNNENNDSENVEGDYNNDINATNGAPELQLKDDVIAQEMDMDNMLMEMATKQAPNAAFDNGDGLASEGA